MIEESIRKLKLEQNKVAKTVASLNNERMATEKKLDFLRKEVKELKGVAAAKDQQKARIQSDLEPLLSEVEGKKGELEGYMKEVTNMSEKLKEYNAMVKSKQDELSELTNQIETSSKLLEDIKLNINNSRTGFDTVIVGSSQDTQVETPTLLPALLLSVLLNIVTGGHILLSNVKASKKRDSTIGFNGLKDILPSIK